jgi:hypothetical protein
VAARRPGTGCTARSLATDSIGRGSLQVIRIDDHLRIGLGRRGKHARHVSAAFFGPRALPSSPETGENGVGWAHLAHGDAPAAAPGSDPAIRSVGEVQNLLAASTVPTTNTASALTRCRVRTDEMAEPPPPRGPLGGERAGVV